MPNRTECQPSVAIVAYEGVQMSAVLGLEDLFLIANRHSVHQGEAELSVLKFDANALQSDPAKTYSAIILPPNLSGARGVGDTSLVEFIKNQHRRGSTICSACAGVFWLGEAGLITGKPVTTHWALESEFQARFPDSILRSDQILVDENDIVTAGGMMAWIDLGLFLVERILGPHVLTFTARQLLVDPRGRQQSNYRTFRPRLGHEDRAILGLQHWMEGNPGADLSIKDLAQRTNSSERTFIRRFKAATGLPPNTYVQNLRIEKARALLERTREPVQRIGWAVGYQDVSAFGRVFKSVTGTSPGEYRSRFGIHDPNQSPSRPHPDLRF